MSEKTVRAKFLELVVIRATARNHMSGKPKPIPQREGAVPRNDGPAAVVTLVCQMPNRSRMEIDIKAQVTMGGGGVSVGFSLEKEGKLREALQGLEVEIEPVGSGGRFRPTRKTIDFFRDVIDTKQVGMKGSFASPPAGAPSAGVVRTGGCGGNRVH